MKKDESKYRRDRMFAQYMYRCIILSVKDKETETIIMYYAALGVAIQQHHLKLIEEINSCLLKSMF